MVSNFFWGKWEVPVLTPIPVQLPKSVVEKRNMGEWASPCYADPVEGPRLVWSENQDCTLDKYLYFPCGSHIVDAKKWIKIFQRSVCLSVLGSICFEAVVWKYFRAASFTYSTIISRVINVVGLVWMACRWWGAFSQKKAIEQQINNVADKRIEFYSSTHKFSLFYSSTHKFALTPEQILHPREAWYWAQYYDAEFKKWAESLAAFEAVDPKDLDTEIAQLTDPPQGTGMQILEWCCAPSPVVQGYQDFKLAFDKAYTHVKDAVDDAVRVKVKTHVGNLNPIIQEIESEWLSKNHEEILTYWSYGEAALTCLFPEELKNVIKASEDNISTHFCSVIRAWKQNVAAYLKGEANAIPMPDLHMQINSVEPQQLQRAQALKTQEEILAWQARAMEATPTQGEQDEYYSFIEEVADRMLRNHEKT
jgi:hypothetical protein